MTPVLSALVLTNLLYVVGAVVVASLVSGLYVLRHRKPKSLESGIESFSRELRALAPERRGGVLRDQRTAPGRPRPAADEGRHGNGAKDPAAVPAAEEREDAAQPQPPSGPGAADGPGGPVADGDPAADLVPDGMPAVPAPDDTAPRPPSPRPPGPAVPTDLTVPTVAPPSPAPRAAVPPGTDAALTDYGDGRNPGGRSG